MELFESKRKYTSIYNMDCADFDYVFISGALAADPKMEHTISTRSEA